MGQRLPEQGTDINQETETQSTIKPESEAVRMSSYAKLCSLG